MLSELALQLAVGAMVVDGKASAVVLISTCTLDFSELFTCSLGFVERSLSLFAEFNMLDLFRLCLLFFALRLFLLLFGLLLSFVVCFVLSNTIEGPILLSDSFSKVSRDRFLRFPSWRSFD